MGSAQYRLRRDSYSRAPGFGQPPVADDFHSQDPLRLLRALVGSKSHD